MQEILLEGLIALIAGMSTVFSILILISLVISLFKYIPFQDNRGKDSKNSKNVKREMNDLNKQIASELIQQNDMNQVVAAISVALAASLDTTVDKLRVMSIRQL